MKQFFLLVRRKCLIRGVLTSLTKRYFQYFFTIRFSHTFDQYCMYWFCIFRYLAASVYVLHYQYIDVLLQFPLQSWKNEGIHDSNYAARNPHFKNEKGFISNRHAVLLTSYHHWRVGGPNAKKRDLTSEKIMSTKGLFVVALILSSSLLLRVKYDATRKS